MENHLFSPDWLYQIAARAKENVFQGVSALIRRRRRRRRLKSLDQVIALQLFCFSTFARRCTVISADSSKQNMLR